MNDRDEFAKAALTGVLNELGGEQPGLAAERAYRIADAMLRESSKSRVQVQVERDCLNQPLELEGQGQKAEAKRAPNDQYPFAIYSDDGGRWLVQVLSDTDHWTPREAANGERPARRHLQTSSNRRGVGSMGGSGSWGVLRMEPETSGAAESGGGPMSELEYGVSLGMLFTPQGEVCHSIVDVLAAIARHPDGDGLQLMSEELQRHGWVCCPPGSAELHVVTDGTPVENDDSGVVAAYTKITDAVADPANIGDGSSMPTARVARYVRAPEKP